MSLFTVTLATFMAVASLFITIAILTWAAQTTPKARIRKRLEGIGRNAYSTNEEIQGFLKDSTLSEIEWFNQLLARVGMHSLHVLLERANLNMSVGRFLLLCASLGAAVFLVLSTSGQPFMSALMFGVVTSFFPYLYLAQLARKRLRLFLEQLPNALDVVSRGLEAGLGLTQAVVTIAREMPDPVGTEFAIFTEELNLGLPIAEALRKLQERIPLQEVRMMGTGMIVQREVGGSLAELLGKLSDMVRERFRLERQLKTLTAQNRMSAYIVSALPVVVFLAMYWSDPEEIRETLAQSTGQTMYGAAIALETLGILVFSKLIQIRI